MTGVQTCALPIFALVNDVDLNGGVVIECASAGEGPEAQEVHVDRAHRVVAVLGPWTIGAIRSVRPAEDSRARRPKAVSANCTGETTRTIER